MVEILQADREAAVELAHALGMTCEDFTSGACDVLVQALARHRLSAEHRGYLRAVEDAARVAECRHEEWRMPHPDDALPGEVCDDVSACRDIATAIRKLKPEGEGER